MNFYKVKISLDSIPNDRQAGDIVKISRRKLLEMTTGFLFIAFCPLPTTIHPQPTTNH